MTNQIIQERHTEGASAALEGCAFMAPRDRARALASVASVIAAAERGGGWHAVEDSELVRLLTEVMRKADEKFERVGGSTRHHVRDCLIPELEAAGLVVWTASPQHTSRDEQILDERSDADVYEGCE